MNRARTMGRELIEAARAGRARDVARLLEAGAPPNARDPETGGSALHLAAAHGHLDAVDHLVGWIPVDRGARDAAGRTPLGACVEGTADPAVVKVLVSVGVAPEPWMVDRVPPELARWLGERVGRPRARDRLPDRFAEAAWTADAALSRRLAGSATAQTRPVGDGFAFVTGAFDNTRNGVVCSRLAARDADAEVASTLAWLRERRVPGQWLLEAETEPTDLRARLERAGCRPERSAVHMAARLADLDLSPRRAPEGLDIVRARDADGLHRHAARLEGDAIGAVIALVEGPIAEVLELEVDASQRRRGIGRALVLHALRQAAAAGATTATIAPTPATVPFYEALGLVLERYPRDRAYYTPL